MARELITLWRTNSASCPTRYPSKVIPIRSPTRTADYSNWELSVDRANTCRRLMQQNGMRYDQVADVRGFADQIAA